jgi:hypothetical protein
MSAQNITISADNEGFSFYSTVKEEVPWQYL